MKTFTKFLAGVVTILALALGMISCSTEPEIKYVEKEVIVSKRQKTVRYCRRSGKLLRC